MWLHCNARPGPRTGLPSMRWDIGWGRSPAADGRPTSATITRTSPLSGRDRTARGRSLRPSSAPRAASSLQRKA